MGLAEKRVEKGHFVEFSIRIFIFLVGSFRITDVREKKGAIHKLYEDEKPGYCHHKFYAYICVQAYRLRSPTNSREIHVTPRWIEVGPIVRLINSKNTWILY